jgi:AraC-like DNA-binding protein
MDKDLYYKFIKPDKPLADFVESFWFLHNQSDSNKETIGLPDGRIDLSLFKSAAEPFRIMLLGVGTQQYDQGIIPANSFIFTISFKLLAVEYIFRESISDIVNNGKILPAGFWNFDTDDLKDFDAFYKKASKKIKELLPAAMDERKRKLFGLIYSSNGEMSVKELSEKVFWSSRQINRYFNQQFGVSLKAYCNILRFRASLEHIAQGKLFPELNFTDQTHFIKEIKKFSGVVPKELSKNKNDRFVLLSVLKQK